MIPILSQILPPLRAWKVTGKTFVKIPKSKKKSYRNIFFYSNGIIGSNGHLLCGALNNVGVTANGVDMDVISELLVRKTIGKQTLIRAIYITTSSSCQNLVSALAKLPA